jgi:hypothetical protein
MQHSLFTCDVTLNQESNITLFVLSQIKLVQICKSS